MTFLFEPLQLLLIILTSSILTGLPIGLGLLSKKYNLIEIILSSMIIGLIVPALLLTVTSFILPFTLILTLLVHLLVFIIGLIYLIKFTDFKFNSIIPQKIVPVILLCLIIFMAFWLRIQPYSPIYQELDPYYYLFPTQQILTDGSVPLTDDTAWYPLLTSHHRSIPIVNYIEASWYNFYTLGGEYDNYLLSVISSFYPPIIAGLMVFLIYLMIKLMFKEEYLALGGASLIALMPVLIVKMFAGVSEAQPFGLFAVVLFVTSMVYYFKTQNHKVGILNGILLSIVFLGSMTGNLIVFVMIAYIIIQSVMLYINGTTKGFNQFIRYVLYFVVTAVIGLLLRNFYMTENLIGSLFSSSILILIGSLIISGILYLIKVKVNDTRKRTLLLIGLIVIGVLCIFIIPQVNQLFIGQGKHLIGQASFTRALSRTIAEQKVAGEGFSNMIGILGHSFGDGIISTVLSPFAVLLNLGLSLCDILFSFIFGLELKTIPKGSGILPIIIVLGSLFLSYNIYNETIKNNRISLNLFMFIFIMPIVYVGLNKVKYFPYLGIVLVILFVMVLYDLIKRISPLITTLKLPEHTIKYITILLILILLLCETTSFGSGTPQLTESLLSVSLSNRLQDNPVLVTERFNELCSTNSNLPSEMCSIQNLSFNEQYSQSLCQYSLMTDDELLQKTNITEVRQQGILYKCSRVTNYWISSMEWLRDNVNEDDRITSWWDYGHWINYLGQSKTVLRNEHSSSEMIGRVAYSYLLGNEQDLLNTMYDYNSSYAIFDMELNPLSKYGALNYLGCDYINETSYLSAPFTSQCEFDNYWEQIIISKDQPEQCTISQDTGLQGIIGYTMVNDYNNWTKTINSYPRPTYCIDTREGTEILDGGEVITIPAIYYLNDSAELTLNKGVLRQDYGQDGGNVYVIPVFYYPYDMWIINNTIVSGWNDRKGTFYDSNLYKALYLNQIPGFELVYNDGQVKIFKVIRYENRKGN